MKQVVRHRLDPVVDLQLEGAELVHHGNDGSRNRVHKVVQRCPRLLVLVRGTRTLFEVGMVSVVNWQTHTCVQTIFPTLFLHFGFVLDRTTPVLLDFASILFSQSSSVFGVCSLSSEMEGMPMILLAVPFTW
jgi:hypothetical protein